MGDEKYIFLNRDLSWLSFNYRVLMEAADKSVPLYNRISFLSIFSSNLDEFFRVRMPSIFAFTSIKAKKTSLRDEYPKDLVQQVQKTIFGHLEEFGRILSQEIIPELKQNNICLCYGGAVHPDHKEAIREYFLSKVLSFLQPVLLKKDKQPTVFLENNALYFIAEVEPIDQPGVRQYALVNIPSSDLPRFMKLSDIGNDHHILFLDDVIRENLTEIFPGFNIHGAWSIKLTRDAEMSVEDEFSGDIAEKIERQLEKREMGHATRLLFDKLMPEAARKFVQEFLILKDEEMMEGGRYHNLKDLSSLPDPKNGKFTYPDWPSFVHPGFDNHRSVFSSIADCEKLLHLPYHSYNHVLRFFNEAAIDPAVKEIYITLYRVAANSHIANALISAAKNGKKVVVFVELKARFDEANNLRWSKKMKAAGVKIINSIPRLKVHAKVALVKRWQNEKWENYTCMATGNFNEATGRFYTDHVFFSSDPRFSSESEVLFEYLQTRKQPSEYPKLEFRHLLVSQFNMIESFDRLIKREIENVKQGKIGRIIIKLNNLQEREMITRLYQASNAGVKIEVIARSICCLAAGIKGQSEHITVHRIVDRYLEHARVFIFHNDGNPEYFMGSADWMNRNLHSRIEVIFPIYDKKLQEQIADIHQLQLNDNVKGVLFTSDLDNKRKPGIQHSVAAQQGIYEYVKKLASMQQIFIAEKAV